ncbi:hypothetical protein [Nocardia goodfellowii]|uniref:Uncharacterized protein n=1 Tax=Nocardia goodfellowii TaxID=882446 RepID=A0ABS4QJG8_9NOCA|nr:hypothetical protein [Nocardia goodfellowii]MBP2191184.1 hypothetical protein [Nocardia goodfellowii]
MSEEQLAPRVDATPEPGVDRREGLATLSLREANGVPTLVAGEGTLLPASITAVDESGAPVAVYSAQLVSGSLSAGANPGTDGDFGLVDLYGEAIVSDLSKNQENSENSGSIS